MRYSRYLELIVFIDNFFRKITKIEHAPRNVYLYTKKSKHTYKYNLWIYSDDIIYIHGIKQEYLKFKYNKKLRTYTHHEQAQNPKTNIPKRPSGT